MKRYGNTDEHRHGPQEGTDGELDDLGRSAPAGEIQGGDADAPGQQAERGNNDPAAEIGEQQGGTLAHLVVEQLDRQMPALDRDGGKGGGDGRGDDQAGKVADADKGKSERGPGNDLGAHHERDEQQGCGRQMGEAPRDRGAPSFQQIQRLHGW